MAQVKECPFCHHQHCGDTCECILRYGNNLQKKIVDWNLKHAAELLPPAIIMASLDERWKLYSAFLDNEAARAREHRKASNHASALCKRLQAIADKDMEKFDPEFYVLVTIKCIREARY